MECTVKYLTKMNLGSIDDPESLVNNAMVFLRGKHPNIHTSGTVQNYLLKFFSCDSLKPEYFTTPYQELDRSDQEILITEAKNILTKVKFHLCSLVEVRPTTCMSTVNQHGNHMRKF